MTKAGNDTIPRYFYLDLLRALAIFAVIILHNSAFLVDKGEHIPNINWFFGVFYTGITRFCVPVFVAISGSLLLNKNKATSIKELFSKRLPKLVIPLVVWSAIYFVFQNYTNNTLSGFSLKNYLVGLYSVPMVFHFWFLYMMIGIYLISPIINLFIKSAERVHIQYFLAVWFTVNCVLGISENFTGTPIGIDLNGFGGYVGYFVLGYYLQNFEFDKSTVKVMCMLTVLAFVISVAGIYLLKIYQVKNGDNVIESDFTPEIPVAVAGFFFMAEELQFFSKTNLVEKDGKRNKQG